MQLLTSVLSGGAMGYYVLVTSVLCVQSVLGLTPSQKGPLYPDDIILSEKVPLNPDEREPLPPSTVNEDRIVGGQEADIEDYPYQVSFIVNNSYFCGGIIISENYILTAAHCAQNVDPKTVVLRAGSSFRKNGTIIPIAEVTPHPEYDDPPFDKDVAVMKTVSPMEFGPTMQPIPMADEEEPIDESGYLDISGWGRTQQGASSIPERLMATRIPVVSRFRCKLVYYSVLTENMLCGGNFFLGGKGTCQGDSGGPATQNGKLWGITSYGRGCAQSLSPSVFAKITSKVLRLFIKLITGL